MAQESTRERNPRGEGGRLRIDLLEAAAELMAKHGSIDKVSVRAVAAAAGVSPTAVYRHFDNHTDLLWAAVQYCFDEFSEAVAPPDLDAEDLSLTMREMGRCYVRFAMEHQGKYRVMFSNRVELPARAEPVGETTFEQLVDLVRAILDQRDDDRDPTFVAVQIWTWIHGMVDLIGSHPDMKDWPDIDLLLDELQQRLDLAPR